jgi:hypothetical protein
MRPYLATKLFHFKNGFRAKPPRRKVYSNSTLAPLREKTNNRIRKNQLLHFQVEGAAVATGFRFIHQLDIRWSENEVAG